MAKALLFVNVRKENARILADEIVRELDKRNFRADIFTFEGKPDFGAGYDIAFSLGGDGTVLYAARLMAPLGVPVFPVNLGTLGFMAAVHPGEWREVFDAWLQGKAPLSRRLMLETRAEREGREFFRSGCLNDTVISATGNSRMARLRVCANPGENPTELGRYRADGLIIATPTGSTAYSVAAGGPILDPELEALVLNPICPFTLSCRPIVLPAQEALMVEVEQEQKCAILLTVDGQVTGTLEPGDRVYVSPAPQPGILVASDRKVFYHALKTKFFWLETPGNTASPRSAGSPKDGASHA